MKAIGLLVGGLVPALGYGLFSIMTKAATQAGIGAGAYLALIGVATLAAAAAFQLLLPGTPTTLPGAAWSFTAGAVWSVATGCISLALARWGIPISKLNPLFNTNTLIAVVLGLWVFAEWRQVDSVKLLIGASLILAGALLVSRA